MMLVLEATRRAVGLPITIIAGLFLLYGLYGSYLPGCSVHFWSEPVWGSILMTLLWRSPDEALADRQKSRFFQARFRERSAEALSPMSSLPDRLRFR